MLLSWVHFSSLSDKSDFSDLHSSRLFWRLLLVFSHLADSISQVCLSCCSWLSCFYNSESYASRAEQSPSGPVEPPDSLHSCSCCCRSVTFDSQTSFSSEHSNFSWLQVCRLVLASERSELHSVRLLDNYWLLSLHCCFSISHTCLST